MKLNVVRGIVISFLVGIIITSGFAFILYQYLTKDMIELPQEVSYCQVENTVYCINGRLMNRNPEYKGYNAWNGYDNTFYPVERYQTTLCSCNLDSVQENSKLLTDLKESVSK